MPIDNLAYRSDVQLLQMDGAILVERDDYWVVSFPRNEDFVWGNFLLFKQAPRENDFSRWIDLSKKELGNRWYMAIGWEGWLENTDVLTPFSDFGFEFDQCDILTCSEVRKPLKHLQLELSPCESDDDWLRVLDSFKFIFARGKYKEEQLSFYEKRFSSFRRMTESGRGQYFEAKIGTDYVGSFGLFHFEGTARFQEVVSYPRFRNMGVAQSMCFEGMNYALANWEINKFLTVADVPEALSCYRNLGFQSVGIQESMRWIDPRKYPK